MGIYRNDEDMRQQLLENFEHELALARKELEKKKEEIRILQSLGRVPPRANDLETMLQATRQELKRTRRHLGIVIGFFWFSVIVRLVAYLMGR